MSASTLSIIAIVGALLAPLVTYFINARKLSGKIATSEAADLWEESRAIRESLEERNTRLRERIDELEHRVDALRERNAKLWLENGTMRRMLGEHEATIKSLREEMDDLRKRNATLERENRSLRKRVKELEESHAQ